MKMCEDHWTMLREEITKQGMGEWMAPNGEIALEQLANQLTTGEDTPVNHDPLMSCHMMIMQRSVEMAGLIVLTEQFGCPICRFNEHRTEDGRCTCDNPECPCKKPGSVPNHEEWLVGENSCVAAERAFMVEKGWLK